MHPQWSPDLEIGIEEIDEQHRDLFAQIGRLHDAVRAGDARTVDDVFASLRGFADRHFTAEERLMATVAYPGLDEHREDHRAFVPRLDVLEADWRLRGASMPVALSLADWLLRWIREHLRRSDADFARYLRERGGGPASA